MIFAAPGQSFEAVTTASTGLAGTLGVRIMDGAGGTTTVRTTAGIVESPDDSGIYIATLTAPAAAGGYVVTWDTGGLAPTWSAEQLVVTSSTPGGALPLDGDLTTVAAVRAVLQKQPSETAQDDVIQQFITRASGLIMVEAGREFAPPTDGEARVFAYRGGGMVDMAPYDLRAADSVVMRLAGSDETLVVEDDYELRPLPASEGVYRWIQLPRSHSYDRWTMSYEGTVTVTGDWGFPAVPPEVEHFCVMTVAIWLRRDVQAFSATYNLDEGRLERPEALPAAVRAGLRKWRRTTVLA